MDIPRYAKSLVDRYGARAGTFAQAKADGFLAVGDDHEAAVWEEIVRVIAELSPPEPTTKKEI